MTISGVRTWPRPRHAVWVSAPVLSTLLLAIQSLVPAASQAADEANEPAANAAVAALLNALGTSQLEPQLQSATKLLVPMGDDAIRQLERICADPRAAAACVSAELLWRIAQQRRLSDRLASFAARLLDHEDPFTRALAEWAIATKIQLDNGGQEIRWPSDAPPKWFLRWSQLDPDFLLEADYARLAITWNAHHQSATLLSSVEKIIQRAEGAASEANQSGSAATRQLVARQRNALQAIQKQLANQMQVEPDDLVGHRRLWIAARRAARPIVLANPALDFSELVFVKRHSAHSHRNITGSQYPWIHKPGGDICIKSGLEPHAAVRRVIGDQLGPGHVHGIDLWWDADRIVFGWASQENWPPPWDTLQGNDVFRLRADQEPTHLYEIRSDGTALRQLTNDPYWSDFEPTYCADGRIAFASDRSGRSSECGKFSADHTVINLYAVEADGSGIRRLSDNKDIDRYPHSLNNGTIGYTRWEYQERHFHEVHSLWTVRPDGTMADAVCKQHTSVPYGLRDTRSIGDGRQFVSIATGHHTFAYGPVVIVDPRPGINASNAIRSVTPHSIPQEGPAPGPAVDEGGVPDRGGLYQTPWALSDRCFLVAYSHARPASGTSGGDNASGWAIYLIDVWGNKELIHRELLSSCSSPIPLRPRTRPPIVPDVREPSRLSATCYLSDVYRGMTGVTRGTIKYLRICQRVGWPLDDKIGAMRYIPGNAWEKKFGFWAWAPARVIGTVEVEDDGSAYFEVPADTAVYFQALDNDHLEVRRMRSHISFQPGELRGCVGCHETRPEAPPTHSMSLALRQAPVRPTPPPWGATRLVGYEWLIQPIFDKHCVRCHGDAKREGGLDLTAARTANGMMRSYLHLFGHRHDPTKQDAPELVSVSNRFGGAAITQPAQFGSRKSRLIEVLKDDTLHGSEVRISQSEWIALVTWIDLNAPYYDTFFNRRPSDGGEPRRDVRIQWPEPFANAAPKAQ